MKEAEDLKYLLVDAERLAQDYAQRCVERDAAERRKAQAWWDYTTALEKLRARAHYADGLRAATHRCKVCGALWRLNPAEPDKYPPDHSFHKATWSLASKECGKCCDNVAMGDQIEPIGNAS